MIFREPSKYIVVALFGTLLLALLRAAIYFSLESTHLPFSNDQDLYLTLATSLRNGIWDDPRVIYGSAIYPLFLAIFPSLNWIFAGQLALGVINSILVGTLAAKYYQDRNVGVIAGVLFSLHAPILVRELQIEPTTLAITFLLITLSLLHHAKQSHQLRWWYFLGIFMMLTVFTHYQFLFLPIVFLFACLRDLNLQRFRAVLVAAVIVFVAFSARGFRIDGSFVPFGANPTIVAGQEPDSLVDLENRHLERRLQFEKSQEQKLNWQQVRAHHLHKQWTDAINQPRYTVRKGLRKLQYFLAKDQASLHSGHGSIRQQVPILYVASLGFLTLLGLALFALITPKKWPRDVTAVFVSLLIMYLFFIQSGRLRLPVACALTIPAALGLQNIWLADRKYKVLSLVFVAITIAQHLLTPLKSDEQTVATFVQAKQLTDNKKYVEALAAFDGVAIAKDNVPMALVAKSMLLDQQGKTSASIALLSEAEDTINQYGPALTALGNYYLKVSNPDRAFFYLDRAARGSSARLPDPDALLPLGKIELAKSSTEKAKVLLETYLSYKPYSSEGWLHLVQALNQLGVPPETVLKIADRAIRFTPINQNLAMETRSERCFILERMDNQTAAKQCYEQIVQMAPASPYPLINLALHYKTNGDEQKYNELMDQAKKLDQKETN